jgi:lysozyme
MQLSNAGLALIKRSEGFRSHVYQDVVGIPTIGYGHRLLPHEIFAKGLTETEATELLQHDVHEAENAVTKLVKVPLTQGQFDALVDFVFNLGSGRLAHATLLRLLNEKHYDEAAQQLLSWDHAGNKELPALKARREAEYNLWHAK